MSSKLTATDDKKIFKMAGISFPYFLFIALVVFSGTYYGVLPHGIVGAFPLMIVMGAILNEIGGRTPIIKDYLGGGVIVAIFGSAAISTYKIIPQDATDLIIGFMKNKSAFLDFYIAALITGSILGIDRMLLIRASLRYLPAIIAAVIVSLVGVGIFGQILGFGARKAVLYIGLPIMGGGMGAGAVPLSQIFGHALDVEAKSILSVMVPALALGNAMAIVCAGLLDKLGKKNPRLTGNGRLMKTQEKQNTTENRNTADDPIRYINLGVGLLLSTTFFVLGSIMGKFIPIHPYALMILFVCGLKIFRILPEEYEKSAAQWFQFMMINLTPTVLVGIGIAYTDLNVVIQSLTPTYITLVFVTIVGAILGAGLAGQLMKFYFVESAITAGLCMANMGGTGDVAVLSASKRLQLMPFAQISSRIGGAFMLILATVLLTLYL